MQYSRYLRWRFVCARLSLQLRVLRHIEIYGPAALNYDQMFAELTLSIEQAGAGRSYRGLHFIGTRMSAVKPIFGMDGAAISPFRLFPNSLNLLTNDFGMMKRANFRRFPRHRDARRRILKKRRRANHERNVIESVRRFIYGGVMPVSRRFALNPADIFQRQLIHRESSISGDVSAPSAVADTQLCAAQQEDDC